MTIKIIKSLALTSGSCFDFCKLLDEREPLVLWFVRWVVELGMLGSNPADRQIITSNVVSARLLAIKFLAGVIPMIMVPH